jgi:hypothetical protein
MRSERAVFPQWWSPGDHLPGDTKGLQYFIFTCFELHINVIVGFTHVIQVTGVLTVNVVGMCKHSTPKQPFVWLPA